MNEPLRRIGDLVPGARYRIRETFADFDGDELRAGTELTFVGRSYFPYDGGHTLTFAERVVRLAEIDPNSSRVLDDPGRWIERIVGS